MDKPRNREMLVIMISCFGVFATFFSYLGLNDQMAFAQALPVPVSNITGLPDSGLQTLLLTKNGGLAGLDEIYSYNVVTKELASVDLKTNLVQKKVLNSSEIEKLNGAFYSNETSPADIFDRNVCPDCIQYGLSFFFIDLEKHVPISAGAFWTDSTAGAESNMKFAELIQSFTKK
jgi:hypothetical protein